MVRLHLAPAPDADRSVALTSQTYQRSPVGSCPPPGPRRSAPVPVRDSSLPRRPTPDARLRRLRRFRLARNPPRSEPAPRIHRRDAADAIHRHSRHAAAGRAASPVYRPNLAAQRTAPTPRTRPGRREIPGSARYAKPPQPRRTPRRCARCLCHLTGSTTSRTAIPQVAEVGRRSSSSSYVRPADCPRYHVTQSRCTGFLVVKPP